MHEDRRLGYATTVSLKQKSYGRFLRMKRACPTASAILTTGQTDLGKRKSTAAPVTLLGGRANNEIEIDVDRDLEALRRNRDPQRRAIEIRELHPDGGADGGCG